MAGHSAHGRVHHETGRPVRGCDNSELAHSRDGIVLTELNVPARDLFNPAFGQLGREERVHDVGMIQRRLPGGLTVLERDGRLGEVLGRRKDGADRDRTVDSQKNP